MSYENDREALNSTAKIISILITIDTDAVMKAYPNPSKDKNKPTGIGHNYGFMVAGNTKVNKGQGTGDLDFSASVGDAVRMYALSTSNNFDDSILLYKINKFSGTEVFSTFRNYDYYKDTPVPGSEAEVLPEKTEKVHFWFHEASIRQAGTEDYKVTFALYKRNNSGKSELFGYYDWDPRIQVDG